LFDFAARVWVSLRLPIQCLRVGDERTGDCGYDRQNDEYPGHGSVPLTCTRLSKQGQPMKPGSSGVALRYAQRPY
jgi:hypothetical protein